MNKIDRTLALALLVILLVVGILQVGIYNRQAGMIKSQNNILTAQRYIANTQVGISNRQSDIANAANLLTEDIRRAFVSAADVRIDKKPEAIPGQPRKFETYFWFLPNIENGGNTPTKNLRISAQAVLDPSRPGIEAKLPVRAATGAKQTFSVRHLPEAGPGDPEEVFVESEELERQGKPAAIISSFLGPMSLKP